MSWKHHEKILQIKEDSHVALAKNNISIKNVADILEKPSDEKSKKGAEATKKSIQRNLKSSVVFQE